MLAEKYQTEIAAILAKYPADQKRSAVMPLLYLAQSEYGYVSKDALAEVAGLIGVEPTQVASVVGFYTLYHDHQAGQRYVQVCTDLPCALRGAEKFAGELCAHFGVKFGETTQDGEFTFEEVPCLAACDKAPMFQVQDANGIHYHESESPEKSLTIEQAAAILENYKK